MARLKAKARDSKRAAEISDDAKLRTENEERKKELASLENK